jgi:hypothetical protein
MKWGAIVALAIGAVSLAACGGDDDGPGGGNEELFTTAGFRKAYDAATERAGEQAAVLEVQITSGGADFKLRSGEQATGFVYRDGELHDQRVEVIGPGSLEGQDFPISAVDPAAIDRIVSGVRTESGIRDIEVTVLTLAKSAIDGKLRWTINAAGGGRTGLVYNADPDGSNVTSPQGAVAGAGNQSSETTPSAKQPPATDPGATVTLPNGKTAAEVSKCIQKAQGDVDKLQACVQ